MRTLLALVVWCLLFVLCWPLALLALVLWPFVWLLALPFRLVGITFEALRCFVPCSCFRHVCLGIAAMRARVRHEPAP